jgi:THO complex subunit 3
MDFFPRENNYKAFFSDFKQTEHNAHKKEIYCIKWNCTGTHLASGSRDCSIKIWSNEKGGLDKLCDFKDHTGGIEGLTWHPDSPDIFASVSEDKTLRIWDIRTRKSVKTVKTEFANLNIAWSPDGNNIAVGNKEDHITIFDYKTQNALKVLKFEREVNQITWDHSGNIFFITTSNESGTFGPNPIYVLDGKSLNYPGALETLDFHRGKAYCITLDPKGEYFATGAADAYVALWDLAELAPIKSFNKENYQIRDLSFSHDGKFIAVAAEDKKLDIYDVHGDSAAYTIECNSAQLVVSWNPKKYLLAYTLEEKDRGESINLFGL